MKTIEKIMRFWAKIISIGLVIGVLYSIHILFRFIELYFEQEHQVLSLGNLIITMGGLIFVLIFGTIFYSPFIYYGWFKDLDNSYMKSFTKIMTVMYAGSVLFGVFMAGINFSEIWMLLIVLAIPTPLYYYAWRN